MPRPASESSEGALSTLPAYLQPQPVLVQETCMRCIRLWGRPNVSEMNENDEGDENSEDGYEIEDESVQKYIIHKPIFRCTSSLAPSNREFVKAQSELANNCGRPNRFSKCSLCCQYGKSCEGIDPQFRRAVNILLFLRDRALNADIELPTGRKNVATAVKYAKELGLAVIRYNAALRSETKKAGGVEAFRKERRLSREDNINRHKRGLGGVGRMAPTNETVNGDLEKSVFSDMNCREKRQYWWGVD